jgi:hypothetical protein
VDWGNVGDADDKVEIPATTRKRSVEPLGDKGAVVLKFSSNEFYDRWEDLCDFGCSWDYDDYHPHVSITYQGSSIDLTKVTPYSGRLVFGPERFSQVVDDWETKIDEKPVN